MSILMVYGFNAIAGIIVFTLFEYFKVLISTAQGDTMPKQKGKLTPNPLKFIEPIGFLLFVFSGYGWSNPAETSPFMYKNRKMGIVLTYSGPIIICILLGKALAVLAAISANVFLGSFLSVLARAFVSIGIFNIIPVYPLAGSWILRTFISPNSAMKYAQYEKIILMLLAFGLVANFIVSPLNMVISAILG